MGAKAYYLIDEVTFNKGECAVEIGAERGEGSTEYLDKYCEEHKIPFYSVDIVPQHPKTIKSEGSEWLSKFEGVMKFAYLDNFDYIFDEIAGADWVREQIKDYEKLGYELNNENSMNAHLLQAKLVHERSVVGSHILLDDTFYIGYYSGKGGKAVPWLLETGQWELINEVGDTITSYAFLKKVK